MNNTTTPSGYPADKVMSALQNAIQRGQIQPAYRWALELETPQMHTCLWNQLRVISVEDIGLANPGLIMLVDTEPPLDRTIYLMATSPKSRLVSNGVHWASKQSQQHATTNLFQLLSNRHLTTAVETIRSLANCLVLGYASVYSSGGRRGIRNQLHQHFQSMTPVLSEPMVNFRDRLLTLATRHDWVGTSRVKLIYLHLAYCVALELNITLPILPDIQLPEPDLYPIPDDYACWSEGAMLDWQDPGWLALEQQALV